MAPSENQKLLDELPKDKRMKLELDNNGNIVSNNRAYRRNKPPTDNWFTKATHSIRKKRQNAKKAKHNR